MENSDDFESNHIDKAINVVLIVLSFYVSKGIIGAYSPEAAMSLWNVVPGMVIVYPLLVGSLLAAVCLTSTLVMLSVDFLWGRQSTTLLLQILFPSQFLEAHVESELTIM